MKHKIFALVGIMLLALPISSCRRVKVKGVGLDKFNEALNEIPEHAFISVTYNGSYSEESYVNSVTKYGSYNEFSGTYRYDDSDWDQHLDVEQFNASFGLAQKKGDLTLSINTKLGLSTEGFYLKPEMMRTYEASYKYGESEDGSNNSTKWIWHVSEYWVYTYNEFGYYSSIKIDHELVYLDTDVTERPYTKIVKKYNVNFVYYD